MKFIKIDCLITVWYQTCYVQSPKLPPQAIRQMDSLFAPYAKVTGISLGIFDPSKVLFSKEYGMANLDYNLPNISATVFNLALFPYSLLRRV